MHKNIINILLILLILAILLNINWLNSFILGVITCLLYFLVFAYLLGQYLFSQQKTVFKLIIGCFSLLTYYSLSGAVIYYFYKLDIFIVNTLFLIISIALIILNYKKNLLDNIQIKIPKIKHSSLILIISYLGLWLTSLFILLQAQTTQAINSPWQVIPSSFFIIYFIASLNLLLVLISNKNFLSTILIYLHFFLTTTIALFIYKLGYGFDPFIHQATEQAIFNNGFILPKPFYYIGQYSLVVFFSYLLQISTEWADKLLLPLFLNIFLPYSIYSSLSISFGWKKSYCKLLSLLFLFLPFSLFLVTTPQAVAMVFVMIILFLSFLYLKEKIKLYPLVIMGITTLFIHAFAGIPILIYLIVIYLLKSSFKIKKILIPILVIVTSLILPAALFFNSLISIYKVNFNLTSLFYFQLPDVLSKQYNYFLDLAYFYNTSIFILLFTIALVTFIYLIVNKKIKIFLGSYITFIILIINALLLKTIELSHIIDYEQLEFANRIWQLSFYFLLPPIFYAFYIMLKISLHHKVYKIFILILLPVILTASLYISYPRYDDYTNSKFINVSQADFDIVNFIDNDSQNNYIVLANQMTSAAALKRFGFNYYHNEQYFYPIPTGGKLYNYFEKMIYENPSKATITEAMDLTGVNLAYFVMPASWHNANIIIEKTKKEAEQIFSFNNEIYIFKFKR